MTIGTLRAGHPYLGAFQGSPATRPAGGQLNLLKIFKIFNPTFAGLPPFSFKERQTLTKELLGGSPHLSRASDMSARESSDYVGTEFTRYAGGHSNLATSSLGERKESHKPVGSMTRAEALSMLGYESYRDPTPSDVNIELNRKRHELLPENYDVMPRNEQAAAEAPVASRLAQLTEAADILKGKVKPLAPGSTG
jgi:hypothetical protein